MAKETDLNHKIQHAIRHLDPVRVENVVGPGFPDIEYIGGTIESKLIQRWPKRVDTIVRVPHYRPDQRAWHVKRRKAGGRCHVVIQVDTTVFVFDAFIAAQGLGFWTRQQMASHCKWMSNPWDGEQFRRFIDAC